MSNTKKYETICTKCKSPVYYYPAKLLIGARELKSAFPGTDNKKNKTVSCTCTGVNDPAGVKHTLDYEFPTDFKN